MATLMGLQVKLHVQVRAYPKTGDSVMMPLLHEPNLPAHPFLSAHPTSHLDAHVLEGPFTPPVSAAPSPLSFHQALPHRFQYAPRYASTLITHQFLLLASPYWKLSELKQHILDRYQKLYPHDAPLVIRTLRDRLDSDLDDDYAVMEVLAQGDWLQVIPEPPEEIELASSLPAAIVKRRLSHETSEPRVAKASRLDPHPDSIVTPQAYQSRFNQHGRPLHRHKRSLSGAIASPPMLSAGSDFSKLFEDGHVALPLIPSPLTERPTETEEEREDHSIVRPVKLSSEPLVINGVVSMRSPLPSDSSSSSLSSSMDEASSTEDEPILSPVSKTIARPTFVHDRKKSDDERGNEVEKQAKDGKTIVVAAESFDEESADDFDIAPTVPASIADVAAATASAAPPASLATSDSEDSPTSSDDESPIPSKATFKPPSALAATAPPTATSRPVAQKASAHSTKVSHDTAASSSSEEEDSSSDEEIAASQSLASIPSIKTMRLGSNAPLSVLRRKSPEPTSTNATTASARGGTAGARGQGVQPATHSDLITRSTGTSHASQPANKRRPSKAPAGPYSAAIFSPPQQT